MDQALWDQTVEVATSESSDQRAAAEDTFQTDLAEAAVAALEEEGLDVRGEGFQPTEVELTPAANSRNRAFRHRRCGAGPSRHPFPSARRYSSSHQEASLVTLASINRVLSRGPFTHRRTGSRSMTSRTVNASKPNPRAIEAMSVGGT